MMRELRLFVRVCVGSHSLSLFISDISLLLIVCTGWSSGSRELIDFAGVAAAQHWHIYFCIILMRPIDENENKANSDRKFMHSF